MPVLGVGALLDRGLGPPGANLPAPWVLDPPVRICRRLVFACVLRVFCERERERIRERIREREIERERN